MELQSTETGWLIRLDEAVLDTIQIDFRLGLVVRDATSRLELFIGTPCRLKVSTTEFSLTPGKSPTLAPILPLFNSKVLGITVRKTGLLQVEFGNNGTLEVDPNDHYEAWQMGILPGVLFVCAPGGAVSLFREKN
jgi:Family of unknown function (DUF6188)